MGQDRRMVSLLRAFGTLSLTLTNIIMKKLLLKWFPSFFKVSYTLDLEKAEAGNLGIVFVDTPNDKIYEALAISEKKADDLEKFAFKALIDTDTFTDAIRLMEAECKHVNELVYGMFVLSNMRDKLSNPISGIMLRSILGKE